MPSQPSSPRSPSSCSASATAPTALALTAVALLGGAAFVAVNVVLVATAVSFHQRLPLGGLLRADFRHAGPAFVVMAFLAALAVALWREDPLLLVLLAGPLFALTLYQRSALASKIANRDAHTDSLTGLGNHRAYELELHAAVEDAAGERHVRDALPPRRR